MSSFNPAHPYCVIPARYASSRFPGKPLAEILGKPMVLWVAESCGEALGLHQVVVASDDAEILRVAATAGFRAERTSSSALTGTDRVAEVARKFGGTTVVNVQGDEPLVDPSDISRIASIHRENPGYVINGFSTLSEGEDPSRVSIPKVVLDNNNNLLFASRAVIPLGKSSSGPAILHRKQVCIYAFSPEQLELFSQTGRKTPLESIEDIEILRFLELGQAVRMVKTKSKTTAVDEPGDITLVESILLS